MYIDTSSTASNQNSIRALTFSPTANNNFAYSIGYGNTGKLKYVATDLSLVDNHTIPVELASFNAIVNDNNVTLNWITSSELNNSGFEVERRVKSLQSTVSNSEFETIGFVVGRGTTAETKDYSFIDKEISAGNYSYRLMQIDLDGSFEYSNVVEVEVETPAAFALSQNYPNPFNPTTKIEYSLPFESNVRISVYNTLGEKVRDLVNTVDSPGLYRIDFYSGNLASGVYIYKLEARALSDNKIFTAAKKMIIMK